MSEVLIALIIGLSLGFLYVFYEKQKEIKRISQTYSALQNENKALLQQLSMIREYKAYEGMHLKEVQQAFDDLDQSILKLRATCKIKPQEPDGRLNKWQGITPIDEGSDLSTSQIKISFSAGQSVSAGSIRKIADKK